MGIQENKQVIVKLFENWNDYARDWNPAKRSGILDLLSEELTWWNPVRVGTQTKMQIAQMLEKQHIFVPDLKMSIVGMTAEGDQVAVEAESKGTTPEGEKYHNHIHMLFTVKDGKVTTAKEYMDSLLVWKLFASKLAQLD